MKNVQKSLGVPNSRYAPPPLYKCQLGFKYKYSTYYYIIVYCASIPTSRTLTVEIPIIKFVKKYIVFIYIQSINYWETATALAF